MVPRNIRPQQEKSAYVVHTLVFSYEIIVWLARAVVCFNWVSDTSVLLLLVNLLILLSLITCLPLTMCVCAPVGMWV